MVPLLLQRNTTRDESLLLYAELGAAEVRSVQRRLKEGGLSRIHAGIVTNLPQHEWPDLISRHRIRVLAALFPGAVVGFKSAFAGGATVDGIFHLTHTWRRKLAQVFDQYDIENLAPGYGRVLRGRDLVKRQYRLLDEVLAGLDKSVVQARYVDRDELR